MPSLHADPTARAVALGFLGRREEARGALNELMEVVPAFEKNGREIIRRIWHYEKPVELILEGLQKAGMKFGSFDIQPSTKLNADNILERAA